MNKSIITISLIALLLPAFAFASIDVNLRYGSRGDQVRELQEFLIDQGFLQGSTTGNFYSLTLRAVKAFQAKEGITPVSGFVGSITRQHINNILATNLQQSNVEASTTPIVTPSPTVVQVTPQPIPAPQTVYVPSPAVIYVPTPSPTPTPAPTPAPTPVIIQSAPVSQAKIEIYSPNGGQGLGRQYLARPDLDSTVYSILAGRRANGTLIQTLDETNSVFIGAILTDPDAEKGIARVSYSLNYIDPLKMNEISRITDMVITATDAAQNVTLHGTGSLETQHYVNGVQTPVLFYPFKYYFRSVGNHTITFTALGVSQSVTVNVPNTDTRP